ncbi:hypothetical protein [Vreelandella sp. TE19]
MNRSTIRHLVELREIAEASATLAQTMSDVAYLSDEPTEQQVQAWATAFRCMGERATTLAYDVIEEEEEGSDAEPQGGHDAD